MKQSKMNERGFEEEKMKKLSENGITLVALVVTIIIMLILAGVALNATLGDNGLFKMAQNATSLYKDKSKEEEEALKDLENQISNLITGNPTKVTTGPNGKPLIKTINNTKHDTIKAEDSLGNPVTIPGGFKFAGNDEDTVENGIIIEDDIGNQFVWIPVSNIDGNSKVEETDKDDELIKLKNGTKVEITLGRYIFKNEYNGSEGLESGTLELKQRGSESKSNDDKYNIHWIRADDDYADYKENSSLEKKEGWEGAKNLNDFVESVKINHGYYMGRFEASLGSGNVNENPQIAVKPTKQNEGDTTAHKNEDANNVAVGDMWTYIQEEDASKVSQNMYEGSQYVESDLVNSYAWDTAIVFIQAMGNTTYSMATCETHGDYGTLKNTGDTGDEQCHIFDMTGNLTEWTTEYSTAIVNTWSYPVVYRGGSYQYKVCTAARENWASNNALKKGYNVGFRPLMYLKLN